MNIQCESPIRSEFMPHYQRRKFGDENGYFSCLEWLQASSRTPLLHFHHANGMNAQTYEKLLDPIGQHLRVLAMDARGHGQSTAPADPKRLKSWTRYRDDLIVYLESWGEPLYLAGHSLGAVVSMHAAAKRPDLVRGLVMIDPVMFSPGFQLFWRLMKRVGLGRLAPPAKKSIRRNAVWGSREEMLNAYRGRGIFKACNDDCLVDYIKGGTRDRDDGRVELSCHPLWETQTFATASADVWRTLSRIEVPLTLVYGGKSDTFLPQAATTFRKVKPDARFVCVEQAGHFVPIEEPQIVRDEIMAMCGAAGKH